MKTGGYDVLVEINERLVNHMMSAAFYSGFYTAFEGSVVPQIDPRFGSISKVDYRLELKEPPYIDFIPEDQVMMRLSIEAMVKVIGRKVRTDVTADLMGRMMFDHVNKVISVEVLDIKLRELRLLDRYGLPKIGRLLINDALVLAIRTNFVSGLNRVSGLREVTVPASAIPEPIHLGDEIKMVLLPGFPGLSVKIPAIQLQLASLIPTQNLNIGLGEMEMVVFPGYFGVISDQSIAVGISMGENVVGVPSEIKDFTDGNDMAIGLSEASINRLIDQIWVQVPKDLKIGGHIPVDNIKELLDTLHGIKEMPARFDTLGLTNKNTKIETAWVDFSAVINPQRPSFRLGRGGTLEVFDTQVNGRAKATVRATEVTTITKGRNVFSGLFGSKEPAEPEVKKEEVALYDFDSDMSILLKRAVVDLVTDEEGRLKLDITDVDFSLDIPWHLPKFVLDQISNQIENSIKKDFPAIDISQLTRDKVSSLVPFTPDLKITQVSTEGSELVIVGNIGFLETPKRIHPMPSFVADERMSSKEVHRANCRSVHRIPEQNRVGYTSLYDALADGLKGAHDCLPELSHGLAEKESVVTLPRIDVSLTGGGGEKGTSPVPELKPIPIVEPITPVVEKVIIVQSTEQVSDSAGHEVKSEKDQEGPAPDKKDAISPSSKEAAGPVDRE